MKRLLLSVLILVSLQSIGQVHTSGKNSPVIIGANNKVNYLLSNKTVYNIPDNMVNYVAGLLMMNRIDKKDQVNQAVLVWIGKYNFLLAKIKTHPDDGIKTQAQQQLQLGNFPEVEKLLAIKTSYTDFSRIFSNAITTSGDNSPVISGDYNNVSYSVSQIIQYDLPEGVTLNLLNQLKTKDNDLRKKGNNIQVLQTALSDKQEALQSWIIRYKQIAMQLKNSPDAIGKAAFIKFQNGDLDGALKELDKSSGTEISMATNRLLKARILTLQFNYRDIDAQLEKVKTYYETSVPLIPTYENNMDYCRFLIDFQGDAITAMPILKKTLSQATTLKEKVETLNYLAMSLTGIGDRMSAMNGIQQALKLIDQAEPLTDEKLIERKGSLQYNLAIAYASNNFSPANIKISVDLFKTAITTMMRIKKDTIESYKQITIIQAVLGKELSLENNNALALQTYQHAQQYFEREIKKQPQIWLGLSQLYFNMGGLYNTIGKPDSAIYYLQKSRALVEPNIDIHNKVLFFQLSAVYSGLADYYQPRNADSVKFYLFRLDKILDPFYKADPASFSLIRASIYTDLGAAYNFQGNFPEAINKLETAYNLFMDNIAIIQWNAPKFSICINALTTTYVATRQYQKAIDLNHELALKMIAATNVNPQAYQLLGTQSDSQIAVVYYNWNKLDSALHYIKKALLPTEVNVKQYPVIYMDSFNLYYGQLIQIYMAHDSTQGIKNAFKHYTDTWNNIFAMNLATDTMYRSKIAENLSNFAFTYVQSSLQKGKDPKSVYTIGNPFLVMAETHFVDDPQAATNKYTVLQRASFYCKWAYMENDFSIRLIADSLAWDSHHSLKCKYYNKSRELLRQLPPNDFLTNTVRNALYMLPNVDCH